MKFLIVLCASVLPVTCYLGSLKIVPHGVPNVNVDQLVGTWFRLAHYIPCSWSGAGEFTDGITSMSIDRTNSTLLRIVNSWRSSGMCTRRLETVTKESLECNKVVSLNSLGGMGSGMRARVAIDYSKYDINWGCSKMASDNPKKCEDPSLTVLVRHLPPSPKTIAAISNELRRLFGIDLGSLVIQQHRGKPCPLTEEYL